MSNKDDENRVSKMKDLLSKGGGPGRGGPGLILPKPKPKPKPKPALSASSQGLDQSDGTLGTSPPSSPLSPDMEDPGPIVLNTDSLRQFGDTLDFDFDAVVRQQILDTTPQKDRAALSQSKGLQNRRLPSNVAGKVPEDYSERRRANTYSENIKRTAKQPAMEDTDSPISEEERKQRNLAKLGVQHGNNPLAGLAGLLKRNSSGRGSFSKKAPKSPQKSQGSPVVLPKKKKKSLDVPPSPISARLGSEPPQSLPKSPKSFLRGLRRNSSRSKKKVDGADDMASETSSVVSLPIHTSMDETPHSANITPTVSPLKKSAATNGVSSTDGSLAISENGGFAPIHTSSPQAQLVPLRDKTSTSPSGNRKTTDSAIFKTGSYENLFSASSNLFDTKELDALMGKKEKTPDREPKVQKEDKDATDEAAVSPIPKKKVIEKKSNGPTPIVAIHPVILPKPEKKRSVDSSIRANLHRYESNSSVSKTSLTSDSGIQEEPKAELDSESVSEALEKPTEKVQEKPAKSSPESRKKASLLFEEGDDDLFGPAKTDKDKATPDKPVEVDIRKASLFEDEDELFAEASRTKKEASRTKKEASPVPKPSKKKAVDLFGDSLEVEVEKKDEDFKVPEPKTHSLFDDSLEDEIEKRDVDSKVPEPSKKASLFDDSLDAENPVLEDVLPTKKEDAAETRRKSKEDVLAKVEQREDSRKKEEAEAETKKNDDVDFFGAPGVKKKSDDLFGDAMFNDIAPEAKTKSPKHASLFDEDKGSPSLFTRERKALKTSTAKDTHVSDNDNLFSDVSPKTSPKAERAKTVQVTDVDSFDPLGAIDAQADDELNRKVEKTDVKSEGSTVSPAEDAKDQLPDLVAECAEDSKATGEVTKTTTEEVGKATEEVGKAKEKEPVSTKQSAASMSDSKPSGRAAKEETGKPSWMMDLKKRKDGAAPAAVAPKKKEPEEPPMPEWKKRALERKKKAESGEGSPVPSKKKEPAEAPVPEWKKRALERKKKAEEAKLSNSKDSGASPTRSPLAGRKVNGRSSPLSGRKSPNVSAADAAEKKKSPLTSEYKTRREREREQKEKEEKEKEVKEKEETKEESTTKEDTESSEPRYKTRREREREEKEKEEDTKKAETASSEAKRSKTRQERQREREEMRRKADAEVAELKLRYKEKREKGRQEREKEKEKKEEKPRYKTRREREQEAKEKELKKDVPTSETSTVKATDNPSPTRTKPVLAKKPSIEIISRKKLSSASKSSDAGDDEKSSKASQVDNNRSRDTDDDVFSAADPSEPRLTSNLSLGRTPSPKIAIDALSTVLTPPEADSSKLENGHANEEGEGRKKTSLTITTTSTVSPTHSQNGSASNKNSVSSDSDLLAEPKPTRSQTVSLSSRSPTPPTSTGKSDSVPEWKRQLMERKKSPVHKSAPRKVELPDTDSKIPQWKKELLAKKKTKPDDKSAAPRANRSATVSTTTSSPRSRRRDPAPTPDFMKEFQKKKLRNN